MSVTTDVADLESRRSELIREMEQIARSGDGPLSSGQKTRFDNLDRAVQKVDVDLAAAKLAEATFRAKMTDAVRRGHIETGDGGPLQVMKRTAPGWGDTRPATRDSALAAVERSAREIPEHVPDAVIERATQIIEEEARIPAEFRSEGTSWPSPKAAYFRATSSPAFTSAFRQYVANPLGYGDLLSPEERQAMRDARAWDASRAMSEGGSASVMVPFWLDPAVAITNNGTVSPIRSLATVKTITSNVWHGVTSAGVSAEWIAEATEVADASPTMTGPSISAFKADAYIVASIELEADTTLSNEISGLLADAKNRLEATAFAVGTGSAQPRGIIVASSGNNVAGSSGAAGAATLVAADVFAVAEAVPARYRNNRSAWLAAFPTINKLRQLNAAGSVATQSTFLSDFAGGAPPKLIGYDLYEVSDLDATIVSGSTDDVLLFGDVSQYYVIDRLGMTIAFNPIVLGANRRPTGEVGWVAFWRTGADAVYSGAFRTLRL